jgi:opacity protein-like surface antigen
MIWHLGVEAEGRWLIYGASHDFSQYTYLIGPRYRFPVSGRIQPYAKVLLGTGDINFPYQLAHGSYFAMAPGGGVDFVVKGRWRLRADYEYQIWPSAPGIPGIQSSALKPNGVSAGVSYRIF